LKSKFKNIIYQVWIGYETGAVNAYNISTASISATNVSTTATTHTSIVYTVVRINSNQLATASNDTTIKVWDITTNNIVNTLYGHMAAVTTLAVLPDGYLASGSTDMNVMIWNLAAQTVSYYNMSDAVNFIKLHPTATSSLLVNTATSISIYNTLSSMAKTGTVATTANSVNWLEILAPSGNVLAVGSSTFCIYNFPSLTANFTSSVFSGQILNMAKQLPDNLTVVLGQSNGSLVLFNSLTNTFGAGYSAHAGSFKMLELTPDNVFLITATNQGSVLIMWTWTTMNLVQIARKTVTGQVQAAAFIPPTGFNGSKISFLFYLK
jgi:WD40 repeat protein